MGARGRTLLILGATAFCALTPIARSDGLPSVTAIDIRGSDAAPDASVDAIAAATSYPGIWYWNPQLINNGPGDVPSPALSLDGVGPTWTEPLNPLPVFPATVGAPNLAEDSNFPFDPVFTDPADRQLELGFLGQATTGYDASRTLVSPASDVVPAGGGTQTWSLSLTLRDPSLAGSQIIVQLDSSEVNGTIVDGSVVTPALEGGEQLVFLDTDDGQLAWSISDASVGRTYTLSLQISIPNPGGAFAFKPSIFFEAAPADTFATAGAGTSVSIDDPVLGGTFGYSVGTPVDWQTDIGQSFQANLEQVGPTALDTTPPTIAFVGNNGAYGLLDTVDITCAATDPAPGSGVAVDPCLSFGIDAPAWTFGPGTTTLPQPGLVATDGAGNSSAPATTSFTVTATPHDLCTLTTRFVQGSSRYARLGPLQRRLVDVLAGDACSAINAIAPRLQPARKAAFVRAYTQVVAGLASAGWLTSAQASTLSALAHTL